MVHSDAADVDHYVAAMPEERCPAISALRTICLEELHGFNETMSYGMPCYLRDGTTEVAFASQKQYISVYIMRTDVRDAHAGQLASHDMGKGCLRFRRPEAIDYDLVRSMMRTTAATRGPVC